jgi:hypothetical protein
MRQASAWVNADPAACVAILAKRLRIDPALAASINRTTFADTLAAARMQTSVELAAPTRNSGPSPPAS